MTSRGPAPDTDPFEHDDAAYLLGALTDAERAAFEEHLAGCAACTARVAALQPVAGALATAGRAGRQALAESLVAGTEVDTAIDAEPEAGLATAGIGQTRRGDRVAGLAQLVERRRRRTRWAIGGLAAVAAAVIAALIVTLAVPSAAPADTAAAQPMMPTGAVAISATAAITAVPWGSEITVHCSYDEPSPYTSAGVYALEVVDRSGQSHQIGSWTLAGSRQVRFTSGTALAPDQIGAVNVVERDGTVILRLAE
jgi:hypothetical protein